MERFERARSLGHLVNWAARLFRKDIQRRLRPLGLMPAHIPVMLALAEGAALSQIELARRSQIEQPAMATALVRMEKLGLLARSAHPNDGRVSLFRLTEVALLKLPALYDVLEAGNIYAATGLSNDQQEAVIEAMRQILKNFGGAPDLGI